MQALHNTPGKLFMSIRPFIFGLALAAPLFAQANYSINNSVFSCSAGLSFANSEGLDAHCTGNFSVTGGTWTSDTKIALSADGSLTLDGVAMTAPTVELRSLTQVALLGATLIRSTGSNPRSDTISDGLGQVPGRVELQPGADVRVGVGGGLVRTETGFSGNINGGAISGGTLTLSAGGNVDNPRAGAGSIVTGSFFGGGNIVIGGAEAHVMPPVFLERPVMYLPTIQLTGVDEPARGQTLWLADAVPEPETYTLALAALATGAAWARRRKA